MIEEGRTRWNGPLFVEGLILGAWNIWKVHNQKIFENIQACQTSKQAKNPPNKPRGNTNMVTIMIGSSCDYSTIVQG
jgi:hypothetical protein